MIAEKFARTPRIIGLESEYSIALPSGETVKSKLPGKDKGKKNQFRENGGRLYPDVNDVCEYATPECLGEQMAIVHERAGELIVADTFPATSVHKRIIQPLTEVNGEKVTTAGHHENYLSPREVDGDRLNHSMLAHLSSRLVINGAGALLKRDGRPFYSIGQKAWGIGSDIASTTVGSLKPVINTRDECHADSIIWRRVHVTSGDPNVLDYALKLSLGSSSLVLRLIEHGADFSHLAPENPVTAARIWAGDVSLKACVKLVSGAMMTMLNVQEILADEAVELVEKVGVPDEEKESARLWQETIDTLTIDPRLMIGKIDWVTRLAFMRRRGLSASGRRILTRNADLAYDAIARGDGYVLQSHNPAFRLADPDEVQRAKTVPPRTRAVARVYGQKQKGCVSVDWSEIKIKKKIIRLKDPYDPEFPVDKLAS